MPKCIRCGKETMGDRVNWDDWKLVKAYTDVEIGEAEYRFFQLGLCPDCQLPSEVVGCKDNLQSEGPQPIPDDKIRSYAEWLDNIDERIKFLERCRKEHYNEIHQHEHDIETLGGCLEAMEKRIAKLERESERLEHDSKRHEKLIQQHESDRRAGLNALHDAILSRFGTKIDKLEREMNRVWEVIRCMGEKE